MPHMGSFERLYKKMAARESGKASLNYAYYLMARWPRMEPTACTFMDEAHLLSDVTLDYAGIQINENIRKEWGLEKFPLIQEEAMSMLAPRDNTQTNIGKSILWLSDNLILLERQYKTLEPRAR